MWLNNILRKTSFLADCNSNSEMIKQIIYRLFYSKMLLMFIFSAVSGTLIGKRHHTFKDYDDNNDHNVRF